MVNNSGVFVDSVNFAEVKTAGEVMGLFIKVAHTYPNQADKLFDKYAAFVKATNPEYTEKHSREVAASNISMMSTYYGAKTSNLLYKAYRGLRQY